MKFGLLKFIVSIFFFFTLFFTSVTLNSTKASHSWSNYHWARTGNPFDLKLGDNLSSNWDSYLATTSADWSASNILDTNITQGQSNPKNCKAISGRVEVCNSKYGNNGWLGIAQIWVSGDHITKGVTKVNDTYFSTSKYNIPAWKNLVMCQEVGHTLGLDHQDETFDNSNLNTCMDYTDNPSSNQHPNNHDYTQLENIYTHLDSFTTINQALQQTIKLLNFDDKGQWGRNVRDNGHVAVFERDFGLGNKVITHVIWASE